MPTQPVIERLKQLQTELETISSAVKHIDKAAEVAKAAGEVLQNISGHLNGLKELIDETKKLEKTVSDYYSDIKIINFPARLDKIDNQISAINIGIGNLQTTIQNTQTKIDSVQSSVNSHSQSMERQFSDVQNKLATENILVKKEIRINRIVTISVGAILIIGILLIILLYHN